MSTIPTPPHYSVPIRTSAISSADNPSPNKSDDVKPHACVACAHRKVKCDKRQPCASCVKSRVHCDYRAPLPPQRRKRKVAGTEQDLLERVKRYEEKLKSAGIHFEAFDASTFDDARRERAGSVQSRDERGTSDRGDDNATVTIKLNPGTFVAEEDGQKFYEHTLLSNPNRCFDQDTKDFVDDLAIRQEEMSNVQMRQVVRSNAMTSLLASSLVVGQPSAEATLSHPSAPEIAKLWSIFLENVHPVTKLLHPSSTSQVVRETPSSLKFVTRSKEALLYSIYACAVMSLTEDECQMHFRESQDLLLLKYQSATRHILLDTMFLKTGSLEMLQAFVLLLTSMHNNCDGWSLWILAGVAIRIAQSQGLHRDGTALGLPPFEVELKRRLWWYIVVFNSRTTESTGFNSSILPPAWDTSLPLNINDNDLDPQMKAPPTPRVGATEMTYCLFRYEMARYLQEHGLRIAPGAGYLTVIPNSNPEHERQLRERKIAELESLLENNFFRFCDPVIPLHLLTITMARSMLCKLRHMESYRRFLTDKDLAFGLEHKKETLGYAVRNLSYDNMLHSTRAVRGFIWNVHFHFPWGAPVHAMKALAVTTEWLDSDEAAWRQIEEQHFHHPEYADTKKAINIIVGDLTLKVWTVREACLVAQGQPKPSEPNFIRRLRARRNPVASKHSVPKAVEQLQVPPSGSMFDQAIGDPGWDSSMFNTDFGEMDLGMLDWNQWNNVPGDFE